MRTTVIALSLLVGAVSAGTLRSEIAVRRSRAASVSSAASGSSFALSTSGKHNHQPTCSDVHVSCDKTPTCAPVWSTSDAKKVSTDSSAEWSKVLGEAAIGGFFGAVGAIPFVGGIVSGFMEPILTQLFSGASSEKDDCSSGECLWTKISSIAEAYVANQIEGHFETLTKSTIAGYRTEIMTAIAKQQHDCNTATCSAALTKDLLSSMAKANAANELPDAAHLEKPTDNCACLGYMHVDPTTGENVPDPSFNATTVYATLGNRLGDIAENMIVTRNQLFNSGFQTQLESSVYLGAFATLHISTQFMAYMLLKDDPDAGPGQFDALIQYADIYNQQVEQLWPATLKKRTAYLSALDTNPGHGNSKPPYINKDPVTPYSTYKDGYPACTVAPSWSTGYIRTNYWCRPAGGRQICGSDKTATQCPDAISAAKSCQAKAMADLRLSTSSYLDAAMKNPAAAWTNLTNSAPLPAQYKTLPPKELAVNIGVSKYPIEFTCSDCHL